MSTTVNYIPTNWEPGNTNKFNQWIDKIHTNALEIKGLNN